MEDGISMNTSPGAESVDSAAPVARVLVVEDDSNIRQVLSVYLKYAGLDVATASDGREAMQLITAYRPHLVLLDLMMQPVNGWEVLHWIRAQQFSPPLPVLVLTALYQLSKQVQGFEEGAVEYLTKPTSPRLVVERILTILGLNEEQRAMLQRKRIDEQRSIMERVEAPGDEFVY